MSKIGEKLLLLFAPKTSLEAFGVEGLNLPADLKTIQQLQAERAMGLKKTDKEIFKSYTDLFPTFDDDIKDKFILDYGCGDGDHSISFSQKGAQFVLGYDIYEHKFRQNSLMLAKKKLNDKVAFRTKLLPEDLQKFDIVITTNAFEHFADPEAELDRMLSVLKPEGKLYIAFGPLWYSPFGVHNFFFIRIPWANIIFSDTTIFNARSKYIKQDVNSFDDIGLNKMTLKRFETMILSRNLKAHYSKYRAVCNLIFFRYIPVLRELFINGIVCVLGRK
jgi:SAM-dependent methyltransferase